MNIREWLLPKLVAAGFGVSLRPAYYASARPDGVAFQALRGTPPQVSLQLAWRRDAPPVVEQFVAAAQRLIGDDPSG